MGDASTAEQAEGMLGRTASVVTKPAALSYIDVCVASCSCLCLKLVTVSRPFRQKHMCRAAALLEELELHWDQLVVLSVSISDISCSGSPFSCNFGFYLFCSVGVVCSFLRCKD